MSDVAWSNTERSSPDQLQHLTSRQLQIASLASQGLSNKEVGRRLKLSDGTVKLHLHRIYGRLGLRNRTELSIVVLSSGDRASASDRGDRAGRSVQAT